MGVLCTASAATPAFASSTVQGGGKSRMFQIREVTYAMSMWQAAARWRRAPHAYGVWEMEVLGKIKRA